jgi:hypothetical protein
VANAPELILRTLDRHLTGPAEICVIGGAALILGYHLRRTTEDADLVMDDAECQALIERANFAEAVEATNRELEPQRLYLTHIWGPEQLPLSPHWRSQVRNISMNGLQHLRVSCLGPLDLILSKLARGDDADLADIAWVVQMENLEPNLILESVKTAQVPPILTEVFASARVRLETWLKSAANNNP